MCAYGLPQITDSIAAGARMPGSESSAPDGANPFKDFTFEDPSELAARRASTLGGGHSIGLGESVLDTP